MENNRQQEMSNYVNTEVPAMDLAPEVQDWLTDNADYLADIVNVYAENPDVFGLAPELRENPNLILQTMFQSADTLYRYQLAYNRAISSLAEANSIDTDDLEAIPDKLQEVSLNRERPILAEHLRNGGNIAIALNGIGASGKGTIAKKSGMKRVVNTTTRPARPGEEQHVDYHYIGQMEPGSNIDKDTGYNIIGTDQQTGAYIFETDSEGKPVDYFAKYGPYVVTVHRAGRARHGTSISEFTDLFDAGERAIFFEHGPVQVLEAGEALPKLIPNARVLPVCILAPRSGILPLASRIAVRTYGDPEHKDASVKDAYKINDTYMESTIGLGQIEELAMTADFMSGEKPLGVAYIVNDKLTEAVDALKGLIKPE